MQRTTTAILAISIAAVTVSFLATNSMLPTAFMIAQDTPTPKTTDSIGYLGHVTYVVRGPDGNIKSYVQTDNQRTTMGQTCGLNVLFAPGTVGLTSGNTTCSLGRITSGSTFTGFSAIGLINGSGTITTNGSDTYGGTTTSDKLGCTQPCRASANDGVIPTGLTNEGGPIGGTVTAGSDWQHITIANPTGSPFTFTNLKAAGTTIRGSVLLNSTTGTPTMFAENSFTGGAVTVASADTLTVTWTIQLS